MVREGDCFAWLATSTTERSEHSLTYGKISTKRKFTKKWVIFTAFIVAEFTRIRVYPCVSVANYLYQNIFNNAVMHQNLYFSG